MVFNRAPGRLTGDHRASSARAASGRHLRRGARHARIAPVARHAHRGRDAAVRSSATHRLQGVAIASPVKLAITLLLAVAMIIEVFYLSGSPRANAIIPVSQAQGQFISGSALGTNLNSIVAVNPATATNNGGAQSIQNSPLSVSLLNQVDVPISSGPVVDLVGTNGILDLGAVNQYAEADPSGASVGASGAVDSAGAITLGGGPTDPANATFHLTSLLGGVTSGLGSLTLTAGALTGRAAEAANGTQTGTYQIAGLDLSLQSPLVAAIETNLQTLLATDQAAVNLIPAAINALPLGGVATISPMPTLTTLVSGLTSITSADGSITADLQTGAVDINVGTLLTGLGLDLDHLPPNTDLLAKIDTALATQLVPAIAAALTSVLTAITTALDGITVTVLGLPVSLALLAPAIDPVITTITSGITALSGGLTGSLATPLAAALSTVLSLVANGQQATGGTFTESALTVGLLPSAPTPAAQVVLAAGSVGPNAGPIGPPTATSLTPTSGPDTGGQTVTITGTGFITAATTVTIGGNTVAAGQVNVTATTTLSFSTPAHVAGPVGVTVTTANGTTTPALAYTYVSTPPGTPPPPVITSPVTGSSTTNTTPPIAGTGVAGDTVTVFEAAATLCTSLVDSNSNWSCTSSELAIGSHTIVATQDPPVVTSGPSNSVQFTIDPLPPVILSPVNGSTITDPTPPIGGTGGAGNTVIVTVDGHQVCATTVDVNSDWVCSPTTPLANGHHIALATQTSNGVTSAPSDPDGFTVAGAALRLASTGISDSLVVMLGLLLLQGGVLLLVALSALRPYWSRP
jgi:hypothetical protein